MQPKRRSGLDNIVVCKHVPSKHIHVDSSAAHFHELPAATVDWMKGVDLQSPAILFSSQEVMQLKAQQADLLTSKQYKLAQGGKLFIRGTRCTCSSAQPCSL